MQHPEVSLVLRRIVVANVEGGQLTSRFFLFVVLKTSILKLFKTERKKKAEKRERERERADSYPSLRTSSNRAFATRFDEIDRSNERQRQRHAGLVVVPRDDEKKKKKKERKDNFVVVLRQSRRQKKRRFARSLAKVFDTKTTRHTHPNLLPRSFCCGAVRIEFVHLVVRAFHLVLFFVQRLFFFVAVMSKNEFFKKEKKGGIYKHNTCEKFVLFFGKEKHQRSWEARTHREKTRTKSATTSH